LTVRRLTKARIYLGFANRSAAVLSPGLGALAPLGQSPGGALAAIRAEMQSTSGSVTFRPKETSAFGRRANRPAGAILKGESRAHGYFSQKVARAVQERSVPSAGQRLH